MCREETFDRNSYMNNGICEYFFKIIYRWLKFFDTIASCIPIRT